MILLITGYPGGICMLLCVFKRKDKIADKKNTWSHPFLGHFFHPISLYLSLCNFFQYCLFRTIHPPANTGGKLLFLPRSCLRHKVGQRWTLWVQADRRARHRAHRSCSGGRLHVPSESIALSSEGVYGST